MSEPPPSKPPDDASEARAGATAASLGSEAHSAPRAPAELTLLPDEEVGPYRVRRCLGRGGMGEVYLARHVLLGRLVALKIIRGERLSASERERLLQEARTTASLAHENIVVIHDVNSYRGAPYIALEYLGGETLAARLRAQPMALNEALRVVRAVATALAYAHGVGILHCDLKPSNIMLPPDGRPRVVDFGLAAEFTSTPPTGAGGTPGYMAPEQQRREPIGPAADVWSLGVILRECLSGRGPSVDSTVPGPHVPRAPQLPSARGDTPPAILALLQAMLDPDPSVRPTATRVRDALDTALGGGPAAAVPEVPFRGLQPFEETHAAVFHGRSAELDHACERLRSAPVLTVIGPSGVGKSSFVQAGLVARLRREDRWTIVSMRPGRTPLETLAARLISASAGALTEDPATLAATLRAHPASAALRLGRLAGSGMILLVVDQLEELFTHVADTAEQAAFLRVVYEAADDPGEPVRVVVTIRDDFLGMAPPIRDVLVLRPLTREGLQAAICRPVESVGYRFERDETVHGMISELTGAPSELPLLQFACRYLWDHRDEARRLLLASVFDQVGGVGGALASHADAVLASLDPQGLAAARAALLSLVSSEGTRRVRDTAELSAMIGPRAGEILARLDQARVVVIRRGDSDGQPTVELAHEALITRWARLRDWIEDERDERKALAEIEAAAALWVTRGRPAEETWTEEAIGAARRRLGRLDAAQSASAQSFLRAGDAKAAALRWRRRLLRAAAATAMLTVTVVALLAARVYRERELEALRQRDELARAGANLGRFTVTLAPFEWDPVRLQRSAHHRSGQRYALRIHQPSADLPFGPGPALEPEILHIRSSSTSTPSPPRFDVEAPGVPAVLVVERWDARGDRCSDAWVAVKALPGFREKKRGIRRELVVPVPSCEASLAGMVEIPAGSYLLDGLGDPPVRDIEASGPLVVAALDRYFIDRTEMSNAAFAPFREIAATSGMDVPIMPVEQLRGIGEPDHPIAAIDPRAAAAACALWGKRLPSREHWVKAARGGLIVNGVPNPMPTRAVPWGRSASARPNLEGPVPGCPTSCSVLEDRGTASPYGVIHLVGNVREWLAQGWPPPVTPLVETAGGGWANKIADELHTTAFMDSVDRRYFDYQTGVRCVMVPSDRTEEH